MKIAHTPGPWKFTDEIFDGVRYVRLYQDKASPRIQVGDVNCSPSLPYEANARLISAAPELLAALQSLVFCLNSPCEEVRRTARLMLPSLTAAIAAITKATGAP